MLSESFIDCSFRFLYWRSSGTIFLSSTQHLDLDKLGKFCAGDAKCPFCMPCQDQSPESKMLSS